MWTTVSSRLNCWFGHVNRIHTTSCVSNCFMILLFPITSFLVFIVLLFFFLDPVFGKELGRNADESRRVCRNVGHGKRSSCWLLLFYPSWCWLASACSIQQIRNDTSQIVNENLPQIQQRSDEMRQIYRRIDKLEVSDNISSSGSMAELFLWHTFSIDRPKWSEKTSLAV